MYIKYEKQLNFINIEIMCLIVFKSMTIINITKAVMGKRKQEIHVSFSTVVLLRPSRERLRFKHLILVHLVMLPTCVFYNKTEIITYRIVV